MIAVDTNVLVYSCRADLPLYQPANDLITKLMSSSEPWAICWPCIHEFLSVVTRPRYFVNPASPELALRVVQTWNIGGNLRLLSETPDHLTMLQSLMIPSQVRGGMVHDARIAAICLSHKVEALITLDRDFSRFPQLTIRGL